jgi:hypothetical protein
VTRHVIGSPGGHGAVVLSSAVAGSFAPLTHGMTLLVLNILLGEALNSAASPR